MNVRVSGSKKMLIAGISVASAMGAFSSPANADLTGHLDLASKYYLRGITTTYNPASVGALGNAHGDAPENDGPAFQGGLDYAHSSGFYAGWWFSTLSYSYKTFTDQGVSMEHDLYAGYASKVGDIGYKVGFTRYQYVPSKNATGWETLVGVSYKDFGLNAQTLLNDNTWGNKGDTYWTATYATTLPMDIGFNATLGYYTYTKTGKFVNADNIVLTTNPSDSVASSAFRHVTVGVTYPFMKNLTGGVSYIIGGKNRYDVSQDNKFVGSLSYTF
ncbi:TorF family putative porin [Sulfuriferula sp.]|uniref:TorF family putative porin n=1 Tax=Sulfuriferula sp. TaxID=2025307 RepID=UPI00272F1E99|nr:TorF family putative porin [Sulfuriferula sp.]MDP2024749.1 TorF family putative porin [Sulfuriferula sp.]